MRVTMAQLNPVVGDIRGNLEQVIRTVERCAAESDLVIFSELFLVGYPPKDLVERKWLIEKVESALTRLCELSEKYPETGILVGAPLVSEFPVGKGLLNSAVLIGQGKILFHQAKTLLPTYDVFDEARHFDAPERIAVFPFKGEKLGISICEDAWNDERFWPEHRIYPINPIANLAEQGATLLINISASPFEMGKEELRYQLISTHARNHGIPMIFLNQVGGNDELIFDGGSMIFDQHGTPLGLAPFFEEYVETFDLKKIAAPVTYHPQPKVKTIHQALVLGIKDYLRKCGFKGAVIGLSGGIDSALVCCLAVEALGKENVLGISMPSPYSSTGSVEDSRQLAKNLGIAFEVVPISSVFKEYLSMLTPYFEGKDADVTEENIQARIRGNIVMAFSNKFGYLALSTGNKSEMAVGYCTLYGDMSGGLSAISDVPKTLVYEICEYINSEREIIPRAIIEKAPSAELRPGQRDQDTLPPYPILDQILQFYIEDGLSAAQIIAAGYDETVVKWVIRTVDRSEFKRRQAAPGLKVTSKAFGIGRRMPIAKKMEI